MYSSNITPNAPLTAHDALLETNKWIANLLSCGDNLQDIKLVSNELARCLTNNKSVLNSPLPLSDFRGAKDELEYMAKELESLAETDAMRAPAYSSIFSIFANQCRKILTALN